MLSTALAGVWRDSSPDPGPLLKYVRYWADSIRSSEDKSAFAPGMVRRAEIVCDPKTTARGLDAPTYLTDLGMRRFSEPEEFFQLHAARWTPSFSPPEDAPARDSIDAASDPLSADEQWECALDCAVLLWGDYEAAHALAKARDGLGPIDRPALATYMATSLAASAPDRALSLLDAARATSKTILGQFTSAMRLAAVYIKRVNAPGDGLRDLSKLAAWTASTATTAGANEADLAVMFAMIDNLRALAYLRLKDHNAAELAIRSAMVQLDPSSGDGLVVPESEALRYRTQIVGNAARFAWVRGEGEQALRLWRRNAATADTYSAAETSAGLAYGLHLAGEYDEAIEWAVKSRDLFVQAASPIRLRMVRRILAVALSRSGRSSEAQAELCAAEVDPLGLALIATAK